MRFFEKTLAIFQICATIRLPVFHIFGNVGIWIGGTTKWLTLFLTNASSAVLVQTLAPLAQFLRVTVSTSSMLILASTAALVQMPAPSVLLSRADFPHRIRNQSGGFFRAAFSVFICILYFLKICLQFDGEYDIIRISSASCRQAVRWMKPRERTVPL